MPRTAALITAIDAFQPANGNWLGLEALLNELFESRQAADGVDAMLRVFERYPDDDGNGVFWSIVHGLESIPHYERALVKSVSRTRSEMGLVMIRRMLNAGVREVDGVSLQSILDVR